jgi:uncharacterized protein
MHDLLDLILKNITTYPDEVTIEMANEDGREVYTISVHPDDMGRVIGKSGKVIQAIRSLAHVVAIRQNKHFRINLADSGAPGETSAPSTPQTPADPVVQDDEVEVEVEAEEDLISGAIDIDTMQEDSDK